MFYRQKILLALLEIFGGRLNNLDFQKYLFLFSQKFQQEKAYDFVPYKYGCFSFQSYADRRNLIERGHLTSDDDWQLISWNYFDSIKNDDKQKILNFFEHYKKISGDALVREVYRHYPYYAIKSEIAKRLLSDEELAKIETEKPKQKDYCFFTIGYESSSFESYLNKLIQNNIKLLCDVRKNPISRKYGFSKKTLNSTLEKLNIEYIHLPELGIVSEKRRALSSQTDYDQLFNEYEISTLKENGAKIEYLFKLCQKYKRIAITCFEADHCMCHRGRVAKALSKLPKWDYTIKHI